MGGLITIYIAATVFGVGVTLIDLFGIFGHSIGHGGAHDSGGHGGAHDTGDHTGAHNIGDHGVDHTGAHDVTHAGGHATHDTPHSTEHTANQQQPSIVGHERRAQRYIGIRALTMLRSLVYFSFGFGPIGWIAFGMSGSALGSLLWSIPAGILFAGGGIALRRIQRSVLDSQIRDEEMLMEKAEVIVPIEAGKIGKVRAVINGMYVERFAKAQEAGDSYAMGATVRIVTIADDFVVVSDE
jgi:hypothetical protein